MLNLMNELLIVQENSYYDNLKKWNVFRTVINKYTKIRNILSIYIGKVVMNSLDVEDIILRLKTLAIQKCLGND